MNQKLPAWLIAELKAGRSCSDLVRHATSTMTYSMLFAGVGQPRKAGSPEGPVRVWAKGLEARLWNLPRRTGLRSADLAESRQRFASALAQRILAASQNAGVVSNPPWSRADVLDALAQTKRCLARAAETLRERGRHPPAISDALEPLATPHLLLQASYYAMAANQYELVAMPSDAQAMALFGMASHALVKMRRCQTCFRWALPGHQYCAEHTLSVEGRGSRNERQARYQSGRRASSHFERLLREVPVRFGRISSEVRAFVVARLLWAATVPDEQRVSLAIAKLLPSYPRAHDVVGHGAERRPAKLFDILRERLDQLEYSPGNWQTKLRAAEAWFAGVAHSTPGQRGPGRRSRSRVVYAWGLVRDFDESKSTAAAVLELHPSAISYWLRYKSDDSAVRALVEALEANRERILAKRQHLKRVHAQLAALRLARRKKNEGE